MRLSVNSAEVFAATGGQDFDPKQSVLLFVHGAGCDHTVWQQQTRYFAHHGHAVLAPDLPGHGLSAGPALTSVPALADWIMALVDAVDATQVTLIGHSLGAQASLEAAARNPERVRALALLGAAARMPVHPELLAAATANEHQAIEFIAGWGHGAKAHGGGNIASGIWLIQAAMRLQEQAEPGVLASDFSAADSYGDAIAAAEILRCPTLFILGARDRMTPVKAADGLVAAIDGATRVILPDSGHMMMLEAPDATRDALKQFIA